MTNANAKTNEKKTYTTLDEAFGNVLVHMIQAPADLPMRSSAEFCMAEARAARRRFDYAATITWLAKAESYLKGADFAKRIELMDEEKIASEEASGMAELRNRLTRAEQDAADYMLMYQAANDLWETTRKDLEAMTELRDDAEARATSNNDLFHQTRHELEDTIEMNNALTARSVTLEADIECIAAQRDSARAEANEMRGRWDEAETRLATIIDILRHNGEWESIRNAVNSGPSGKLID